MSNTKIEISKTFTFDAAHHFNHKDNDHPFSKLHGHSFVGTVTLTGERDNASGMINDFWDIDQVLQSIKSDLDHCLLNDVPGLENPSLENIASWVFQRLETILPNLIRVQVCRPSCGESASVSK